MIALTCTLILLLVAIPLSVILWAMAAGALDARRERKHERKPYDSWDADISELRWGLARADARMGDG